MFSLTLKRLGRGACPDTPQAALRPYGPSVGLGAGLPVRAPAWTWKTLTDAGNRASSADSPSRSTRSLASLGGCIHDGLFYTPPSPWRAGERTGGRPWHVRKETRRTSGE